MLIKRIKAKNFKTYLSLDLDISVEADRPIVLIGGENGGGKTTFFEALYGALYGLSIHTAKQFKELLNAGALGYEEEKIVLELHFTGKVLNEEQQYVLTRTYLLNPSNTPVESVKLNMNGTIFQYGTATSPTQRAEQEAQVNKIIKANLPQELSRYFLFDAMEAGNLLKEDQLNKVIKENIENVMGFNKYLQLSKSAENLYQSHTAQRLQVENEKQDYLQLLADKQKQQDILTKWQVQLQDALQYSVANKELYDNLKAGLNQDATLNHKIAQATAQIEEIYKKEALYHNELDAFIKDNIEQTVCLPKLGENLKSEIQLILKEKAAQAQQEHGNISPEKIANISDTILLYLKEKQLLGGEISRPDLLEYVVASLNESPSLGNYTFLDADEVKALAELLHLKTNNIFPILHQQKVELQISVPQIGALQTQIALMKAQITGRDYALLKAYEDNEAHIKKAELAIQAVNLEISKIEKKLHQFDIQTNQEPDPKYDTLGKLKGFFEAVSNQLLKSKKQQIELKMKQDLNINLAAYREVIERVELSENLKSLTFKLYHKSGNEIYLNQLNTASKQVVIQVLLKSLHEFGDYDPPVMIDTVMGVLDETSRATVLENYFPELSHQTILLSSDSEIRKGKDFQKIETFISKAFTLQRDREKQLTNIIPGYFGINLKD